MQRKFFLETTLKTSLEKNDIAAFRALLNIMRSQSPGSMKSLHENNKSFIFIAIESEAFRIALELLDEQQDDDDILFAKDDEQRSLLHIAAAKGNLKIINKLIEIAKKKNRMQDYLEKDNAGFTVLHHAAESMDPAETIKLLVSIIGKYTTLADYVNRCDLKGNTALHYAMKSHYAGQILAPLLNAGGLLSACNHDGVTVLALFFKFELAKQSFIFKAINPEAQNLILKFYEASYQEALLEHHQENAQDIEINLFTLAGIRSLQSFYVYYFRHHPENNPIDDEVFNKILDEELKDIPVDLLNVNREKMANFIKSLQTYITDLKTRPKYSSIARGLPIVGMIAYTGFTFLPVEKWLISTFLQTYNNRNETNYFYTHNGTHRGGISSDPYFIAAVLFGAFGSLCPIGLSTVATLANWKHPANVSRSEWEAVMKPVEEFINNLKLDAIDEQHLQNFKTNIQAVKNDSWTLPLLNWSIPSPWQSIIMMKTTLANLLNDLNSIQMDMSLFNKPIGFFSQCKKEVSSSKAINLSEPEDDKDLESQESFDNYSDESRSTLSLFFEPHELNRKPTRIILGESDIEERFIPDEDSAEELQRLRRNGPGESI